MIKQVVGKFLAFPTTVCQIKNLTPVLRHFRREFQYGRVYNSTDKAPIEYEQGQKFSNSKIREYFYYLDHQGQLFLDDMKIKNFTSCYKEQKFLEFFFKNLRINETNRFAEHFPFVSLCGRERNYLRCDDLPLVVTQIKEPVDMLQINQISSAHWTFRFDPARLFHNSHTGRLYYHLENMALVHPNSKDDRFRHVETLPCQVALVKSEISLGLLKGMQVIESGDSESKRTIYRFEYKSRMYEIESDPGHRVARLVEKFSAYRPENEFEQ